MVESGLVPLLRRAANHSLALPGQAENAYPQAVATELAPLPVPLSLLRSNEWEKGDVKHCKAWSRKIYAAAVLLPEFRFLYYAVSRKKGPIRKTLCHPSKMFYGNQLLLSP